MNQTLRNGSNLDISGLSDQQVAELKQQHASGMIELKKKAEEMGLDAGALHKTLDTFNETTAKATQEGNSSTITHTQNTSLGRTEVVIGNTDRAKSGKISRSGAGLDDNSTKMALIIGIVAIVATLIFVFGK